MLEVTDPGLLATIQDLGRPGLGHFGVPPSGALDPWGLAVANLIVDAAPGEPAVEVTLGGLELVAREECVIGLAGADLGAERDDGRRLAPERAHRLPAGARLRFTGFGRSGFAGPVSGMRAYLALVGGIAVPRTLGSASTLVDAGLGGLDGRPLHVGERLVPIRRGDLRPAGQLWPSAAPHPARRHGPIWIVAGPDVGRLPPETLRALCAIGWTVSAASDRMGLRLDGEPLPGGPEILSHPTIPGTIQLPTDGRPIVMLADGPTIGGYPVVAVVPRAELPRIGQARPGDLLRFEALSVEDARELWRRDAGMLTRVSAHLRADAIWHALAESAGA